MLTQQSVGPGDHRVAARSATLLGMTIGLFGDLNRLSLEGGRLIVIAELLWWLAVPQVSALLIISAVEPAG